MRILFCLTYLSILCLLIAPQITHAQTESKEEPSIFSTQGSLRFERDMRRGELENDFLNLVINRTYKGAVASSGMLPIDLDEVKNSYDFFERETLKANYPWLYPLIYNEASSSSFLKLNKWVKPIAISFGYPNNFLPVSGKPQGLNEWWIDTDAETNKNSDLPEKTANNFSQILPELTKLTGLSITYIPPQEDKAVSPANLRIVFVSDVDYWETKFRRGLGSQSVGGNVIHTPLLESTFPSYNAFTPDVFYQVDGYYVSNDKNEIQMAVCKIWEGHEALLLQKLVHECILRSLGVTGLQTDVRDSIFYPWNHPQVKVQVSSSTATISAFDKFILKSLYDPKLTPGMSLESVISTITHAREKK